MEVELKFQVPARQRDAVRRAVATATVRRTRLQAIYVDTADGRLAAAGLALRVRKEGRVWVQALKGSGDALTQRLEHEVRLPPRGVSDGDPAVEPALHAGTAAGDRLARALGSPAAELRVLYRTDVARLHRVVRHGGATIEIAYDTGRLLTDAGQAPVDELEFELVSGPPAALATLAARWVQRFGLWWDSRTKSERGTRLALGLERVPAARARPAAWPPDAGPGELGAAALQAALAQALPNASELASGQGSAEHLHQLRVALRRARTVLRVWAPWLPDAAAALALQDDWRAPFAVLGAARDADVQAQAMQPALAHAGAPPFDWPRPAGTADASDCVRSVAFNLLLLRTLAIALQPPRGSAESLADAAARALGPLWRQSLKGAADFARAAPADQHRTRKRLKRLRYALEALAPLFKARPTRRLQKRLRQALEALGELNDLQAAEAACRSAADRQPQAWFAVGWCAARREPAVARAAAALDTLRTAPRVWRAG